MRLLTDENFNGAILHSNNFGLLVGNICKCIYNLICLFVLIAIATSLMFPMKAWKGIQTYAENFNFLDLTSFIPAFREEFGWREAEQVQPITKIRLHY
jgi:hypothetical protein